MKRRSEETKKQSHELCERALEGMESERERERDMSPRAVGRECDDVSNHVREREREALLHPSNKILVPTQA